MRVTWDYDAFGAQTSFTGRVGSSFGFTGAQHDPNGITYLNSRCYSPTVAIFLSGSLSQANGYAYAFNTPANSLA